MKKITNREILQCLEKSNDGVLISNADGEILYINEAYPVLTKIGKAAAPGVYIQDFIRSGIIETEPACLMAVRRREPVVKVHAQNSNRVFIVCISQPFLDEEGEIDKVLTTVQDATEFFDIRDDIENVQMVMERLADNISYVDEYGDNIVAVSEVMRSLLDTAGMVSVFDVPVLILGESGTGKEVVAKYIHDSSHRRNAPFLAVNCAAIPGHLLETELFGYAKGTFTGQLKEGKDGLFGAAKGGTLFLDEIGDMPMELQAKILRVLEMKAYMPVGSHKLIDTDVRILSATNHDLEAMIREGTFREDLYYRLNVVKLKIPPLRERRDDIIPMSMFFWKHIQEKYHLDKKFSIVALEALHDYDWPGNVRELKNVIELMTVISRGHFLEFPESLQKKMAEKRKAKISRERGETKKLESLETYLGTKEREYLIRAYEECGTTRKMAEKLEIDHSTVMRKLKKYHIQLRNRGENIKTF